MAAREREDSTGKARLEEVDPGGRNKEKGFSSSKPIQQRPIKQLTYGNTKHITGKRQLYLINSGVKVFGDGRKPR